MPKSTNPLLRRKSSSPFANLQRSKPNNARKTSAIDKEQRLDDTGLVASLAAKGVRQDVISLIRHIQSRAFDDVPDRGAGMGSERTSEVLRFRKALPPIVTLAHLHAISRSSTDTERELARLVAEGKVRKITVPGRGRGGAAVGDGVVLVEDWVTCIRAEEALDEELREKYIALLSTHRTSPTTPTGSLSDVEERNLVNTGFLTSPNALTAMLGDLFLPPGSSSSLATVSSAGSRAATGTLAAVGGAGAVHESGGSGNTLATRDNRPSNTIKGKEREMTFALPGTGIYLKLLVAARQHLLHILKSISPRHREATMEILKEKWEGNTPNDPLNRLKRERGEWGGVLPGKTKRWKEFYGMRFECVLAECVGSGLVELFDTGAVGMAVRGR
ncbi:hypothetical protein Q7P35_011754 [Cladosporium inversicolor]